MRDGVQVAIDVHVPAAARLGEKVPTIVRQTRYLRSIEWRRPLHPFVDYWFPDVSRKTRSRFVARGYAWIDVDARGSGASFGHRPCPWHENEVRDGGQIVDWIVGQPWSNGRVGASGVSYEGTTAEMLLVNGHPAVKAVVPQFCLFDAYTDVAFPGGVHQHAFTEFWAAMNRRFDDNQPHEFVGMWIALLARGRLDKRGGSPEITALLSALAGSSSRALVKRLLHGVRRTDGDRDYARALAAIASHADNQDIHQAALRVVFRDDRVMPSTGAELADVGSFSPSTYLKRIDASGAAVLGYTGWWDMAYPHAAIKRHLSLGNPGNRLVIGPWDHGGSKHIGPTVGSRPSTFDHDAELARFFDRHLREDGARRAEREAPIRYFTMGEETWKTSDVWPLREARAQRLYLARAHRLATDAPTHDAGHDDYRIDYDATTGHLSRWKSGVGMPIDYSDRARCDERLLVYDSALLDRDTVVTGHPLVTLYVDADAPDAQLFAYLEEVTPSGDVRYVTEGCLRAIHRKLSTETPPHAMVTPYRTFRRADAWPLVPGEVAELVFDLLPTSYLFRRGHSIRLAIAGADRDHARPPADAPTKLRVHRGGAHASFVSLPVVSGSRW